MQQQQPKVQQPGVHTSVEYVGTQKHKIPVTCTSYDRKAYFDLPDDNSDGKPVSMAWECYLEYIVQREEKVDYILDILDHVFLYDMSSLKTLEKHVGPDLVARLRDDLKFNDVSGDIFVTAACLGSIALLEKLFRARMYRAPTRENHMRSHDGVLSAVFRSHHFPSIQDKIAAVRLCLSHGVGVTDGEYFSSVFFWLHTFPENEWLGLLQMGLEFGVAVVVKPVDPQYYSRGPVCVDVLITHAHPDLYRQCLKWMADTGFAAPRVSISYVQSRRRMYVRRLIDQYWNKKVQYDDSYYLYTAICHGDWAFAQYLHNNCGHRLENLRAVNMFTTWPRSSNIEQGSVMPNNDEAVTAATNMIDWLIATYGEQIRSEWKIDCLDLARRDKYHKGSKIAHLNCDRIWKEFPDIQAHNLLLRSQHRRRMRASRRAQQVQQRCSTFEECVSRYTKLVKERDEAQAAIDRAEKSRVYESFRISREISRGRTPLKEIHQRQQQHKDSEIQGKLWLRRASRKCAQMAERMHAYKRQLKQLLQL